MLEGMVSSLIGGVLTVILAGSAYWIYNRWRSFEIRFFTETDTHGAGRPPFVTALHITPSKRWAFYHVKPRFAAEAWYSVRFEFCDKPPIWARILPDRVGRAKDRATIAVTGFLTPKPTTGWSTYSQQIRGNSSYFPWSVDVPKGRKAVCLIKIEVAENISRWDGYLDMTFEYARSSNRYEKHIRTRVFVAPQDARKPWTFLLKRKVITREAPLGVPE